MGILRLILISCAIFGVTYCNVKVNGDQIDPMPITQPKEHNATTSYANTTTTIKPVTVSPGSSPKPNTTTSAKPTTTSTTEKPTTSTSTEKPTTSTSTEKPTTTTSTEKPTTSTFKPTTTSTPKPIPDPGNPQMGNWTVKYPKTNRSCIVVDVAVQFEVLESGSNKSIKLDLPTNATASGGCEKDVQKLVLSWANDSLTFDFIKTNTSEFLLQTISAALTLPRKGPKVYSLIHKHAEFSTPLTKSYKCARVQTLNLTEGNSNVTSAYLHVSHVQIQAFKNVTGHSFDSAMDCEGSITPDIVPIVVGCVLTALVIMVLIAYVIGRRRCQARGYLSM